MGKTVGLVHAVIPAIEPLRAAFGQLAPDVKLVNILDEGLVTEIDRRGSLTPGLVRRLTSLVTLAQEAGAELVLLSCTAYSPVADDVQKQSDIPVLKIDELMVREALGRATEDRAGGDRAGRPEHAAPADRPDRGRDGARDRA